MTNPNPFVPKGSLLEQQSKTRSRFKWAVSGILAVSVIGLVAILIQGCKREAPPSDSGSTDLTSNSAPADMSSTTNADTYATGTNGAYAPPTNIVSTPVPPAAPYQPPVNPVPPVSAVPDMGGSTTEYTVVSGDTLGKIAHAHGVTVKALEAANPGVDPKKLHPKQKLNIPAGGSATAAGATADMSTGVEGATESYVVKSGDTLTKIAKAHHVKVKALQAANNLTTTQIKVGQKLKIPASAEAATAPSTTAPAVDMAAPPATMAPPATPSATPSSTAPTTPAPGH